MKIAKIPDIKVAKMVGPTMSVGAFASYVILTAMTVVGIKVMLDVLTARKVIIERLASLRFRLSAFICSIALIPSGVAALPNPKSWPLNWIKYIPSPDDPEGSRETALK